MQRVFNDKMKYQTIFWLAHSAATGSKNHARMSGLIHACPRWDLELVQLSSQDRSLFPLGNLQHTA
ncbi:hypothetical protein BD779DRAFT_1514203 [Infundibulicybe gibba]|nr:hypothetical protein BD779DRAFT_1514203 [Infundibulicybe gibba]